MDAIGWSGHNTIANTYQNDCPKGRHERCPALIFATLRLASRHLYHFMNVSNRFSMFWCRFRFLMISRRLVEFPFALQHFPFMFPMILSFFRHFAAASQYRYCSILCPIVDDRVLLFPLFGLFSGWFRACSEPL